MAFKMSYSFEGNYRNRPEQNLSGSSRKQTRDVLLQRAHEERQKRQADRLKLKSTETIQSYTRSYLIRKHFKQEQRLLFDQYESTTNMQPLMARLLFFYDPELDTDRLLRMCRRLLLQQNAVLSSMVQDSSYSWLIKRLLAICLRILATPRSAPDIITCLDLFTQNSNVLFYLVTKGYYRELRAYLDLCIHDKNDSMLCLIERPFEYIRKDDQMKHKVLQQFTNYFLCPTVTPPIKGVLIPHLRASGKFPHNELMAYLHRDGLGSQNNLLYCVLALEPQNFVQSRESIKVLSELSRDLHNLAAALMYISDDSDEEEMEAMGDGVNLQDYLLLFNNADRVMKILGYFSEHKDDEEVLKSLTQLCHNLLLVYKDSIRKFMLVYMLALKGIFLNKLWHSIMSYESVIMYSTAGSLSAWRDCQIPISVFCDMFTFYTETLTDSESTDTSGTFTSIELCSMSELLKCVALHLIELAFPMCRSTSTKVSQEILHLYRSSLDAVKKLHMLDMRKNFCEVDFWTKKKIHVSPDLTKKNYLSKTLRPFYGIVADDDDEEHLPPLSTIEQRSLVVLQELPFLIEFNQRVLALRQLCYHSFGTSEARFRNEFFSDNVITVRRAYLYEDAFDKLSQRNEYDLRHKLRIQFINNAGLEEAGIDGGGIFKEFIGEVLKTAFDPNRGFFLLTADNMLYPNPQVHLLVENYTDHYYFIGRLVGKAIFENILVDLPLAEFFLAKLLVDRASAHYLKSLDPVLYRNLLYLRDYNGDVQDLGLDFTLVNNDLGETRVIELKPNGANIPVTNYNRLEYVHRLADLKLNTQIKKQCAAFRNGLDNVVPLIWLQLFSHNELQVIVAGDTQEMDIEDLRTHTAYGGEYTADHPTISLFWRILRNFTDAQKKMLLKFVTSCSRPPLLGFKELNPSFCIQSSGSEDRMPTASTCLNLLKLPVIKEEEALRRKLLNAIEQQAGFELS